MSNNIRKKFGSPSIGAGGGGTSTEQQKTLIVFGGNKAQIGNNIEGIQYSSTMGISGYPLSQTYDPDVDTVYPVGLGNAYLFIDGIRQANKVLVVHNYNPFPGPVLSGFQLRPNAKLMSISYDNGSTSGTISAYTFTWL